MRDLIEEYGLREVNWDEHLSVEYLIEVCLEDEQRIEAVKAARARAQAEAAASEQTAAGAELGAGANDNASPAAAPAAEPAPAPYQPRSVLAVESARKEKPPIRSYRTGNLQLDNLIGGGLNTRELLVVMGPPGGCKTAWAVSTAIEIQSRVPVLYASTELEEHELMARIAANRMSRAWSGIRRGVVARADIVENLDGVNIRILGCDVLPRDGEQAMAMIEQEAAWIAEEQKQAPAVFLDYLQDLARGAEKDVRTRVGDYASRLRALSQQLDCPVVGISSVGRAYYGPKKAAELREMDDATVYMAAAKESGDVDYAAARVLFLDAEDDRDKPERAVRIAVSKSRDGKVGFAGARVVGETGRFYAAPESVREMAKAARADVETTDRLAEAEAKVLAAIVKLHAEGKGDLATYNSMRESIGIGRDRVRPALDRLVHAQKLRMRTIERLEGDPPKPRRRDIYVPADRPETRS